MKSTRAAQSTPSSLAIFNAVSRTRAPRESAIGSRRGRKRKAIARRTCDAGGGDALRGGELVVAQLHDWSARSDIGNAGASQCLGGAQHHRIGQAQEAA